MEVQTLRTGCMGEQWEKRHEIKMRWKGLFKMAETTLYNQDCIAAMQQIGAESIDLIVTEANATKKIR